MKEVVLLVFLLGIPFVSSHLMPPYSTLQATYPGDVNYGGTYTDQDVIKAIGLSNNSVPNNDACALRMSIALNLIPTHQIREKEAGNLNGTGGLYYYNDTIALVHYLQKMYGLAFTSNNSDHFQGRAGIMFVNISGNEPLDEDHCPVLLWDGSSFYQGKGVIHHQNLKEASLWIAPTAGCTIDLTLKQQPSCFPSKSLVELHSGESIPISDVSIGDRVKTYSKEGGVVFSPVITFLDQMPDYKGYYYIITTESQTRVTLSEAHLVFKTGPMRDSLGISTNHSVHASSIRPGDHIFVHYPNLRRPVAEAVIAVLLAQGQGAFAPVTQEGTMIVDGVWVSCYADIVDHELAHTIMGPLRSLYGWAPHVLGARGKYIQGYLKGVLRPIGMRLFGKEKFFNDGPQEDTTNE